MQLQHPCNTLVLSLYLSCPAVSQISNCKIMLFVFESSSNCRFTEFEKVLFTNLSTNEVLPTELFLIK